MNAVAEAQMKTNDKITVNDKTDDEQNVNEDHKMLEPGNCIESKDPNIVDDNQMVCKMMTKPMSRSTTPLQLKPMHSKTDD